MILLRLLLKVPIDSTLQITIFFFAIEFHMFAMKVEIIRISNFKEKNFMDYKMFRTLNQSAGRYALLDFFMIFISNNIRYVFIFVLMIKFFQNHSHKKTAFNSLTSATFTMLISSIIKLFYFKPRPFVKHRVGILLPSKTDSSFPSKHTLLVFAIATSIFLRARFLGLIMLGLSALTGFSRIWVGHHYPSDIVGSALIGSLTSIFLNKRIFYGQNVTMKFDRTK